MSKQTVRILVCCHKDDAHYAGKQFLPIHVGKSLSSTDLGIEGDDTGDNISSKNGSYCELTGMYWAWKNLKDVDVIGLCHYRRYFDFYGQIPSWMPFQACPVESLGSMKLDVPESVIEKVMDGAVVVSNRTNCAQSLMEDYCLCHNSDDYRVLSDVIYSSQSSRIKHSFEKVMEHDNRKSTYNMFIMRWDDFDAYCTWLFSVLGMVEGRIDITHYNAVQRRIYGYMGERLMNVWLLASGKRVIRRPVIWFSGSDKNMSNRSMGKYLFRCFLNNIACKLGAPRYRH